MNCKSFKKIYRLVARDSKVIKLNLKTPVSNMWTPLLTETVEKTNKFDSQAFIGYSLCSKWPPFSRTRAHSLARHCLTARSMMSWLKWRNSSTVAASDGRSRVSWCGRGVAGALPRLYSRLDWDLENWAATSMVRWNLVCFEIKTALSRELGFQLFQ